LHERKPDYSFIPLFSGMQEPEMNFLPENPSQKRLTQKNPPRMRKNNYSIII